MIFTMPTMQRIFAGLLAFMMGPGSHRELLDKSRALVKQGLRVVPQVTCRTLNFEFQFKEPFIFESMIISCTSTSRNAIERPAKANRAKA